ncbi:TMEM43 family protein [Tannerella sp.]|uniref:TMEM43 family protein n=1 Tax=Tannerella sp. TaxID=2382127 RepID=UPI0026DC158E|nr:TMEM43 family protein [Tannerella sp.]MDO4703274.1 TMEM43 family protein [Tannerella sp.]
MAYTKTTTTGYGQRLSGSLKGIVGGLVMFMAGTCLLWWNEGRAVKTAKAIDEAQSVAVHVDDVSSADPSINGKLIHASAFADTKDTLSDGIFGVRELAIQLNRTVEYYQWVEETKTEKRDKIGGGQETVTTYTYEAKWVDSPVKSSDFEDPQYRGENFVLTKVENQNQLAPTVTFGGYTLPDFLKRQISGVKPVQVNMTEDQIAQWNNEVRKQINIADDTEMVHVKDNVVYFGKSPNSPHVGDVRVTIHKVLPADVSLIAKVNGLTFEDYVAKNGESFSRIEMGTISAENMFQHAHDENNMLTWILRLVGLLLVVGGLKAMFSIVTTLLKVLPFLANIADAGIGIVCGVLGFVWSLLVIGIAWLVFRPVIGIALLVVAVGGIVFLKSRSKKKVQVMPGAAPPPPPTAAR